MLHAVFDTSERAYAAHFHPAYEWILVTAGAARVTFGTRTYDAEPGTLVCVGHLEAHGVTVLRAPYARFCVLLPTDETDADVRDGRLLSLLKNRPASFRHALDVRRIEATLTAAFRALCDVCAQPDTLYARERARCLTRLVLMTLYDDQPEAFPAGARAPSPQVEQAQRYLDAHFSEPLSVTALARSAYWSESRFSHLFKEQTGYSPRRYVTLTRLTHAREMLRQGARVADVAARTGFGDVNHFIRAFRAAYGNTPKQWAGAANHEKFPFDSSQGQNCAIESNDRG